MEIYVISTCTFYVQDDLIMAINFFQNTCNMHNIAYVWGWDMGYRQVSNIRLTLEGNKIVDHSDVGAAPTTSSFST